MSAPKPPLPLRAGPAEAEAPADEPEPELSEGALESISAARMQNDVEGLLKLAKQYRSGAGGAGPDMRACFEAYRAAADLGSAVAEHALGLFYLNGGGGVDKSERDAAARFRSAADRGHVASKVFVANFYEIGIHYRADAAKADVWYRNVARSAGVEAEVDSEEYVQALAGLGCVRYCLALADADATSEEDRARYTRLAKTYGFRKQGERVSVTTEADQLDAMEADAVAASDRAPEARAAGEQPKPEPGVDPKKEEPKKKALPGALKVNVGLGATAFFLSLIFMGLGAVGGHLLHRVAYEKVAAGETLPVVGTEAAAVLPLVIGVVGVLPNMLVYRRAAFFKALLLAAGFGIGAEVLWGMGKRVLETHVMQITDFAAAGVLVGLLVFGISGGVRPGSK